MAILAGPILELVMCAIRDQTTMPMGAAQQRIMEQHVGLPLKPVRWILGLTRAHQRLRVLPIHRYHNLC